MMADYGFYQDGFRGTALTAEQWERFGAQARAWLDRFRRIYTIAPSEQGEAMAVCAMAEELARVDDGAVAAASIGSVSVKYDRDTSERGLERRLLRCARMYLDIYRGVGL